jgi:hypothetical protein
MDDFDLAVAKPRQKHGFADFDRGRLEQRRGSPAHIHIGLAEQCAS